MKLSLSPEGRGQGEGPRCAAHLREVRGHAKRHGTGRDERTAEAPCPRSKADRGAAARRYLPLRCSEVSLCTVNPGFPDELCLRATRRTLIGWWRGA